MNHRSRIALVVAMTLALAGSARAINTYPWPSSAPVGIGTNTPLELFHVTGGQNDLLMHSGGSQSLSANTNWNGARWVYTRDKSYAQRIGFYNYAGGGIGLHVADAGSRGGAVDFKAGLFVRDDQFVGLGTVSPLERLHISGANHDMLFHSGGTQGIHGNVRWNSATQRLERTRAGKPAHMINFGYDIATNGGQMTFSVAPPGAVGSAVDWRHAISIDDEGRVGINTRTPTADLAVNGTVLAKEVVVSVEAQNWPDYVFAPDYTLPSLGEVSAHIASHGHLPGVPSAAEIGEAGVNLAEMNAVLLQKIEELTLHLIAQNNRIAALEAGETR